MRSQQRALWTLIVLVSIVLLSLGSSVWADNHKYGGKLVVAHGADHRGLEPHYVIGWESIWIEENLYNGLVGLNEKYEVVPDIAESWTVSDDGLTYTFKIRDDVFFHDGTKCDAECVKWNLERVMDPETKAGIRSFFAPSIDQLEAPDPTTFIVHMKNPYATFLMALAGYRNGFAVISKAHLDKVGAKGYRSNPVGTGPFKFKEWVPNSHVTLVRNENYFKKGLPYLDELTYKVMKDANVKSLAFMQKEVDVICPLPVEQVGVLKNYKDGHVTIGPEVTPFALIPSLANAEGKPHPIFADKRVRQATLGYGIDREEIAKNALLGLATPIVSMIPPGTPGHLNLREMYPYNPEKAKALLQEAGYGPDNPLKFTLTLNTEKPMFTNTGTIYQRQMAKIGVDVKLEVVEKVQQIKKTMRGKQEFDMLLEDLAALLTVEHNGYLIEKSAPMSLPNTTDDKVDEMFAAFRKEMDTAKREQIGHDLQRYVADNMYWGSLTGSPIPIALQNRVQDYVYRDHFKVQFESVWIQK